MSCFKIAIETNSQEKFDLKDSQAEASFCEQIEPPEKLQKLVDVERQNLRVVSHFLYHYLFY